MSVVECDLLIVGAGPVGLYAAYYAGFRGLSTAVVDSLPEVGGQITAMYPEKPIYDIAGFPAVKGRDPAECIDCGACEPVCPVSAISQDRRVSAEQREYAADNARFFTEPLPGRDAPLGMAGGASVLGPIGVDTELVAAYEARSRVS